MVALWTAVIAAMVAVSGWFIGNLLVSRREDRTKRLALTIEHAERQIGEFYAPILGLIEQLDTVFSVKEQMVKEEPHNTKIIETVAYKEYFLPLHLEILEILKHKIHLLEGLVIPESINKYFHHFTSENMYWRLTQEEKINTSVEVTKFPSEFYDDIGSGLKFVYRRHEELVQELRHSAPLRAHFAMRSPVLRPPPR
jgi:hypothetical protein